MKKSLILAALGVAATAATSMGQGYVTFNSYSGNNLNGATATLFNTSTLIGAPYTAALYYEIGTFTDPVNNTDPTSITSLPGAGFTLYTGQNPTAPLSGGYFTGGTMAIPGYTTGAITFEVVAYNGSSYTDTSSTFRGRSGAFTMASLPIDTLSTVPLLGDNGQAMPNFFVAQVAAVPEPSTLALAGLGGFGMLMAFRRKKA